jgi:tRNA-2-methylthio-N6-dimethylallyladenosine synthase
LKIENSLNKYFYLNTIGCQMNVYDSEKIAACLVRLGYQPTGKLETADLVIVNTCTIRAKAEQKAFSFLGRLARLKANKPGLIIGVGGCVAQQEGEKILRRVPEVDLVFGTQAIDRLSLLIPKIEDKRRRIVDVRLTEEPDLPDVVPDRVIDNPVSAFVTIMRGCDNFCTYCVVPHVRGREASRHPDRIIQEIKDLVQSGVKEVTLLGQNVNSYGKKEGLCSFANLLSRVNTIDGLLRIRFTTSHPKDFGSDVIDAIITCEKVCDHIHLPVQSGSDRILNRMNRKYTRALYLDKIGKLRDNCPAIAITSDIIVGFPGETEVDFSETLDLMNTVQFDGLFAFVYSDRPNAPAVHFENKIPEDEKGKRLQAVLALQENVTRMKNQALLGSVQPILVEGISKKQSSGGIKRPSTTVQWTGRTSTNKIVNFYHPDSRQRRADMFPGKIVRTRIEKAYAHSLWGEPVGLKSTTGGLKGEESYAA